jgi:ParB-like nuclease domain
MSDRKDGVFEITTANLLLDQYNPRLYGESISESQEQIMTKIYQRESIDELASSLAFNGYFQEEPIIVVPENPNDFVNIDESNFNDFRYVVIEGNRRTTSVKLLLASNDIVDSDFPKIATPQVSDNLKQLPAIIYKNRDDVDVYLSVRHIAGNRKWDAFAKAKYIFEKVNKINIDVKNISNSVVTLSTQIGDKSNIVKKYYTYYKIFQQIEDDVLSYSSKHIKDRFSLLEVSLASGNTTIANYIGLPPFRQINLEETLIKSNKIDELKDVTQWIFGNDEQGNGSIINDSRQIGHLLKPILANQEATEHLKTYKDLDGAYQLTSGEESLVIGNIKKSSKLIYNILGKVKKYKENPDFIGSLEELIDGIESIKTLIK